MPVHTSALLAFGANIPSGAGSPARTIWAACASLAKREIKFRKISNLYITPCMPAGAGPDYVNAAALVETPFSAAELMASLHHVEAEFGRSRGARWQSRTLDLDLIAFGRAILPDPETEAHWRNLPPEDRPRLTPDQLILPHPRMAERAFVLIPLAEIAPDWQHPATGLSVGEMRDALPDADKNAVKALGSVGFAPNHRL